MQHIRLSNTEGIYTIVNLEGYEGALEDHPCLPYGYEISDDPIPEGRQTIDFALPE
ncbi:MAG: hypothetical protein SFX19_10320 [Alphaproteobacteria bacterium]|nr:hypothetical protein [Alphaproteobacteria bacterium]